MKKYFTLFLVSVFSIFMLTACETMEGMGDDAENAGDEIEESLD